MHDVISIARRKKKCVWKDDTMKRIEDSVNWYSTHDLLDSQSESFFPIFVKSQVLRFKILGNSRIAIYWDVKIWKFQTNTKKLVSSPSLTKHVFKISWWKILKKCSLGTTCIAMSLPGLKPANDLVQFIFILFILLIWFLITPVVFISIM